ncbi:hypothetical protein [Shewanella glacialipiscicola]|uniref:hypothetical protein n=1 Tax=Shewanella glacialipiscicola TaxID=614069 RepID=UPI003D796778
MANAAVAAIQFALETDDGLNFLQLWNEGEFDVLRLEWPDAPEDVYIGADPLYKVTPVSEFIPGMRRIELKTILELPENEATESQVKEWLMLHLGWNGFPFDLNESHPLKNAKLVAESPDSTEITILG